MRRGGGFDRPLCRLSIEAPGVDRFDLVTNGQRSQPLAHMSRAQLVRRTRERWDLAGRRWAVRPIVETAAGRQTRAMGSPERVRVLICDDDEAFRQALRLLLETAKRIEVIGDASNGEEAVKL